MVVWLEKIFHEKVFINQNTFFFQKPHLKLRNDVNIHVPGPEEFPRHKTGDHLAKRSRDEGEMATVLYKRAV